MPRLLTVTIRPRDLPKRRNQILKHLSDPHSAIRVRTPEDVAPGLDAMERHLRAAELYWIAAPMAALAMSAGARLEEVDAAPGTRPSPCGLAYFNGGIGDLWLLHGWLGVTVEGRPRRVPLSSLPVAALSWGPYEHGALVWLYTDRRLLNAQLTQQDGMMVKESDMPPLVPMVAASVPAEPMDPSKAPLRTGPLIQALVATWALMQQELADKDRVYPDKSTRGTTLRLGMPDPEVSVVDLRRRYQPDDREEIGEVDGRRYRHRWVVSGHWRDQPYGPERSLRRKQWIATYIKGPDGAPLLATERVNVWRR